MDVMNWARMASLRSAQEVAIVVGGSVWRHQLWQGGYLYWAYPTGDTVPIYTGSDLADALKSLGQ